MGGYTELIFGAELKESTPVDVIETLKYMVTGEGEPKELAFESASGRNPLRGSSYYFAVSNSVGEMWFDKRTWRLSTRSSTKNYGDEIEDFLEWIRPYIESGSGKREFYAIVTYESGVPEAYYLDQNEEVYL